MLALSQPLWGLGSLVEHWDLRPTWVEETSQLCMAPHSPFPLHEPGCAPRASARAVVLREVHTGLQNKEKEAGSSCALRGFTLFLGTKAPHFPNPSSPRGLGGSLGKGLRVLSISYDKSEASNLMLLICRLIRLRVCQSPQRRAGAGHGT